MSKIPVKIEEEAMENLAKEILNGRQIKNVVKQAHLLVRGESSASMRICHIERVLQMRK